jgi:hypothetical protein
VLLHRLTLVAAAITGGGTALADIDVAPPVPPRVFHTPTAWLQPSGQTFGSAGANHRLGGFFALAAGLGELAEIDVSVTDRFLRCEALCDGKRETSSAWVGSALFKTGISEDAWFSGQPAVALGFRKSFHAQRLEGASARPELAELYVVASRRVSTAALHVGAQVFDHQLGGARLLDTDDLARRIRPMAGASWRPPAYPRTTILADVSFVPETRALGASAETALAWLVGWGVRYQALSWGSVELGIRHRQDDGLEGSTVLVRFNGVTSVGAIRRRLGER